MTRRPRSTVPPRPYTDLELIELEEDARACSKVVRLVFEDGSVIEREDQIGIDRAMAIAFCRDIVSLRAQLAAARALLEEAVALDDASGAGCADGCANDLEDNHPHLAECFITRARAALPAAATELEANPG